MRHRLFFGGMLFVLFSSLLSAAYVVDFESNGGTNLGPIPSTYQPVPGLTITYMNVGVYNGSGTWNAYPYQVSRSNSLFFSFDQPVSISSISLCQFDPSATTVVAEAYMGTDSGGIAWLGSHNVPIPEHPAPAGENYIWQSFTGFAQYGQIIRYIEFYATGGTNPMPQVDNIVIEGVGTTAGTVSLTQPLARAVYQRNNQNIAMVPIQGSYSGVVTRIEARAVVMAGYQGTPTDWQVIIASPTGGTFSSALPVLAGGWYRIEVRACNGAVAGVAVPIDRIGVGEVFITAGQSNSANFGTPAMTPLYDTVSAWTGASWRHGYDPQPIANGTGGSPWSRLMDILVNEFDVPVGFISVGIGGTVISQWLPSTPSSYYTRIRDAITATGSNGFRAILWHQGESDSTINTTAATYASGLNSIIAQSRVDAGWNVPWGIAIVAFLPSTTTAQQAPIRAGQQSVIDGDPYLFQGPDTDVWTGTTYRHDTIHFNALGLQLHAEGWRSAILKYVHPWDMDQDKDVDLSDFTAFSSYWLIQDKPSAARWEMNEATGLTTADSSGNGHDGTLVNGPVWKAGKSGSALSFDGVNDYVEMSEYKGITGTQSRSCCAWVKTSGTQQGSILSWGTEQNGQKWAFRIESNGTVGVGVWGGYINTTAMVNNGQWHYVAAVLNDDGSPNVSEIKLYIDGVLQSTSVGNTQSVDTVASQDVMIGALKTAGVATGYFKGQIDGVGIYDAALLTQQIAELYKPAGDFDKNSTVDLADLSVFSSYWLDLYKFTEADYAARWEMNEATGLTAADSSGNGHDGTLVNGPVWKAGKSGSALSFDGVNDYVEMSEYKGITGTQSRSCCAWVKTSGTQQGSILSWGTEQNGQKWAFRIESNGTVGVGVWGGYINTTAMVNNGQWHYVAAVLNDDGSPNVSEIKLYIDGVLQSTSVGNTQSVDTVASQDVMIGALKTAGVVTGYFNGQIDDVRIYDLALTANQVVYGFYNY